MAKWARSGLLAGAPALVAELGGDYPALAVALGLPLDPMHQPDLPIPVTAVQRLIDIGQNILGEAAFGLRLGMGLSFQLFGPMAALFSTAGTVGKLLEDIAIFLPLHTQVSVVGVVRTEGGVMLSYEMAAGEGAQQRQIVELGFAVLLRELRRHVPDWQPSALYLRHAAPHDQHWHRHILGPNIFYNADRNAIFVETEILGRPVVGRDAARHQQLTQQYRSARRHAPGLLAIQAEQLVRAMLPFAPIDLDRAAKMLGHSRRSLQRKLAMEGRGFGEIFDHVRASLAQSYLHESTLSIGQIADILQFSQMSALSRFMRQRYGLSPRQIRAAARQAMGAA
ncbi:MAG: AraC family transcriptional regulator ligand-binding domain-containing protein [Sphingomonadaceae bacterium]|nr:AraC family transcriptional regulator ligand-binding domain-containing protein [Sphingomonadaceae bacterium]